MKAFVRLAVGHPLARAISFATLSAIGNVLANLYIIDISDSAANASHRPHWSVSLHDVSF